METVVFQCDFCGSKSEEESTVWRRPHCSVELVLRGHRFTPLAGSHTLYGVPFSAPEIEDSRWAATLCDRCMKRISALLGLNLETPEEARWRQDALSRQVAAQAAYDNAAAAGMRGVMTDQFPTPEVPHVAARSSPFAPVAVVQYPTPKSSNVGEAGDASSDAPAPGTLEKNDDAAGAADGKNDED